MLPWRTFHNKFLIRDTITFCSYATNFARFIKFWGPQSKYWTIWHLFMDYRGICMKGGKNVEVSSIGRCNCNHGKGELGNTRLKIFFSFSVLEEEVCRNSSLTKQFNIVFKTWQKPETQDEKWTRVKRTLYVNTGKESNYYEAEQQITLFLCDDKCRNFTIHCTASISAADSTHSTETAYISSFCGKCANI